MGDSILSLRPNRALLLRYLESHVAQAHRSEEQLAVLVIQVQRGAELAALFTTQSIESLLEHFAARLEGICRKQDRIARIGDVEFAMYLPAVLNEGHALLAANKVMLTLAQPFTEGDRTIPAEVKIGIALFPDHGAKAENLLQYAESALTEAKAAKLPYAVYSGRALDRMEETWDMEGALDAALKNGEFEVYYQPKISLHDRRLVGAEALVRWHHPERGVVPPGHFLPVVARSGKLPALTWSVLNMALEHVVRWPKTATPLTVAVNIEPALLGETLVGRIADALGLWGVAPETLILEITETGVMSQPELGFGVLKRLRDRGVRICVDDFGTGYSSLGNFRHIPAGELKIDRSFVSRLLAEAFEARIVRSIIALAKAFDLEAAAAGAENFSTLGKLAALGCDYAQGYCISPPLPAEAFMTLAAEYEPVLY
ncbi:MAG TPA: bifunctional diguanylate cyclase/phosphodiesterase [Gammaproteobacteria bacterium]|nr:bifunctional diguanylate cyclase/phosphodiesterase [Gammaproteobacteria bacterium]